MVDGDFPFDFNDEDDGVNQSDADDDDDDDDYSDYEHEGYDQPEMDDEEVDDDEVMEHLQEPRRTSRGRIVREIVSTADTMRHDRKTASSSSSSKKSKKKKKQKQKHSKQKKQSLLKRARSGSDQDDHDIDEDERGSGTTPLSTENTPLYQLPPLNQTPLNLTVVFSNCDVSVGSNRHASGKRSRRPTNSLDRGEVDKAEMNGLVELAKTKYIRDSLQPFVSARSYAALGNQDYR